MSREMAKQGSEVRRSGVRWQRVEAKCNAKEKLSSESSGVVEIGNVTEENGGEWRGLD